MVLLGVWLAGRAIAGTKDFPSRRILGVLCVSALFMHLAGNVMFQWSLEVVGIALAAPLTMGSIVVTGAVMGRMFLGERLTVRGLAAISVLGAAIGVLGSVASMNSASETTVGAGVTIAGGAAACCAGFAYASLGVVIHAVLARGTTIAGTLWTVSTVGVVSLGLLSLWTVGIEGMQDTTATDLRIMLGAGLFTTMAFLALAKALKLTTLLYINTLNASQMALCAVAGVWLFSEPPSILLWIGVGLTAIGLVMMDRGSGASQDVEVQARSSPAQPRPEAEPEGASS